MGSSWKRREEAFMRRRASDLKKRKDVIDKQITRLSDEARKAILSGPPNVLEEFTGRLKAQEDELKQLEADTSPNPEAIAAKKKEVEEAKRTVAFIQETILSLLPTNPVPTKEQNRGR
jgi:chromosome segregation ATPase